MYAYVHMFLGKFWGIILGIFTIIFIIITAFHERFHEMEDLTSETMLLTYVCENVDPPLFQLALDQKIVAFFFKL